jgi:putative glutamine amidotransferase
LNGSSFPASRRENPQKGPEKGGFTSARGEEAPPARGEEATRHRPIIGLTTYLQQAQTGIWDVRASFLPGIYIEGVTLAGGIATLLPPQPVDAGIVGQILDGIDGLIITGGRDVDPAAYGRDRHPTTDEPDRVRDAWELALVSAAIGRHLPVLGICRGAQVLNVALGGTLHQHLPDVVGHTRHQQGNAVFTTSSIRTVAGTRLAGLIGADTTAQCYHHQAIDRLGDGLAVSARDGEGVIEAVEMPGEDFVLAVQWHPEETLDDLRVFAGLVEAARTYTTERVR